MYIAPGQRKTAPRGQNFDVNRKALSLRSFVARFKKSIWSLILYIFFHDLIHVYSPGAGGIQPPPRRQSFDVDTNFLPIGSSVASFKSLMTIVSEKSIVLPFFHYMSMEKKIRAQGRITPKWIIRPGPQSNSFELLCLSSLPESLTKIQSKVIEKSWRHHLFHCS